MGAAEQALRPGEEVAAEELPDHPVEEMVGAEELPVEELRVEAVAAVSWVAVVA